MASRVLFLLGCVAGFWPLGVIGCEGWFDTERGRLVLPQVWVGTEAVRAELVLRDAVLAVDTVSSLSSPDTECGASFDTQDGHLSVPRVNLYGHYFAAEANADASLRFPLADATLVPVEVPFGLGDHAGGVSHNIPLVPTVTTGELSLQPLDPSLTFNQPVLLVQPPSERRLFVVEQGGTVRTFAEGALTEPVAVETFLDISDRVQAGGEEGLLGLAFDPDYAENSQFYVYYSAGSPRRSVISRFSSTNGSDTLGDAASEEVILEVAQPYPNHNGGMIAFGQDGYLYIGLGDGGSGGDPHGYAQDPSTLLGSILRIDPRRPGSGGARYAIPPDNPFVGRTGFREEIWAYGLRNPYRFSFDRATGALWAGDVGQGRWEEIDRIVAGGNYGWNVYEAWEEYENPKGLPPSAFEAPVWFYGRDQGVSVTGGYVYRGLMHPELTGRYIFGDFGSGTVWALTPPDAAGEAEIETLGAVPLVSGFGEDRHGELYMLSYNGGLYGIQGEGTEVTRFPETLSETGLFAEATFSDGGIITPVAGVIPYDVNAPLWSDGTYKQRWMALPVGATIGFNEAGAWEFPVGTVLIKHFELETRVGDPSTRKRLETRLMVRQRDEWRGLTYRWNDDGTAAWLLSGAEEEDYLIVDPAAPGGTRVQRYHYPSEAECMRCHNDAAGLALGLSARQLNRPYDYPAATGQVRDNQLRALAHAGLFDQVLGAHQQYPALADTRVEAGEPAARAYLDANCAICHLPNGPVPVTLDLRYDTALAQMGIVNVPPASGGSRYLVSPGDAADSVLWRRMQTLGNNRMPPLSSSEVDALGSSLVADWINAMTP